MVPFETALCQSKVQRRVGQAEATNVDSLLGIKWEHFRQDGSYLVQAKLSLYLMCELYLPMGGGMSLGSKDKCCTWRL